MMIWSENLCRLCGELKEKCNFIFKSLGIQTLEYKIKKCLNLCVFKDDYKPKQICDSCYLKINEYFQFTEICDSTNERFNSILLNRDSWTDEKSLRDDYTHPKSVIVNLRSEIDNLQCSEEDLYKNSALPLENINMPLNEDVLQIVGNSNVYPNNFPDNIDNYMNPVQDYNTKKCNIDYLSECTVLRHSSNFQLQNNSCSESDVINYSFQPKVNVCTSDQVNPSKAICTEYFTEKYTDVNFESCVNICVDYNNYDLKSPKNLPSKVETFNKTRQKMNMISVKEVQDSLKLNPKDLLVKKTKPKKFFNCPHCERMFVRRITLNSHIAIHTKNKPYSCEICAKSFAVKSNLTSHQKIHSDQYKCKICQKSFSVPSKLKRHIWTHTQQRPFHCDFENCGKSFSDKSNLNEHKTIHKECRDIRCEKCDRYFKTKGQLKSHLQIHFIKEPYSCDVCKKSYKYKNNLVLHVKKHRGFICPFCNLDCGKSVTFAKHRKECNRTP